jgi:hypothetical protein
MGQVWSTKNLKIFDQVLALNDESVSLWFNDQEHKHDNAKIKDKIE